MKSLNILVIAIHPSAYGYIGGGYVRFLEILKRSKKHQINYILIENFPSFKRIYNNLVYEGIEINTSKTSNPVIYLLKVVLKTIIAGLLLSRKHCIDLIYVPTGEVYNVIPAYVVSKLTKIPWTVMLQGVPVYHYSLKGILKDYSSKLKSLYTYFRKEANRRGTPVNPLIAAILYWFMYKLLRKTTLLTSSPSITEDLAKIEKLRVLTCYPGYAIDIEEISSIPEVNKKYDLIFPSFSSYKGLYDVIKALILIVKRRPETRLVIIGAKTAYVLRKIQNVIETRGLQRNIYILPSYQGAPLQETWRLMRQSKF